MKRAQITTTCVWRFDVPDDWTKEQICDVYHLNNGIEGEVAEAYVDVKILKTHNNRKGK